MNEPPHTSPQSLGDALPQEMARVRDLIPLYQGLPHNAGAIAIAMMRQDLDTAAQALATGDVVGMIRVFESLKGFKE
ncbi:hypothetical protein [Niveispirillum sp.]|uniref:hypothetical protein n=1 Tax=Niveispirillum sp. TaxID=1917217 RepID=UPI001B6A6560|nr:hypothetical protein [Niveispirillum sp.]MBP7337681.1 hypothetical protein [Niveispirillum sp.]